MLWTERHAPKSLKDVVGNERTMFALSSWASAWDKGKRQPPLLLHGPTGTGKSSVPAALASDFGWSLLEINASDLRNKASMSRVTGQASQASTLSGARRLILIDDVDSMFSVDRGGMPELIRILSKATQPVLLTAMDLWDPKLAPLRKVCKGVKLESVDEPSVRELLKRIAAKERIAVPAETFSSIASSCYGDVRSAINDLQSLSEGQGHRFIPHNRDRSVDIRHALEALFSSASFSDARASVFDADVDHDMLLKWIDENLPPHCQTPAILARAFSFLSRASLFDARARKRQYYALWRYSSDLMTGGPVSAGARASASSGKFAFPRQLLLLSRNKARSAQLASMASGLASRCHVSIRRASGYLPLVALLSQKSELRTRLKEELRLTEEDLDLVSSLFLRRF